MAEQQDWRTQCYERADELARVRAALRKVYPASARFTDCLAQAAAEELADLRAQLAARDAECAALRHAARLAHAAFAPGELSPTGATGLSVAQERALIALADVLSHPTRAVERLRLLEAHAKASRVYWDSPNEDACDDVLRTLANLDEAVAALDAESLAPKSFKD